MTGSKIDDVRVRIQDGHQRSHTVAGSAAQTVKDQQTLDDYQRWLQQTYGVQGRWDQICMAAAGDAKELKGFLANF